MKQLTLIIGALLLSAQLFAQETINLPVSRPATNPPDEVVMRDKNGKITSIASVSQPSITVRLAPKEKATGTAVMLFAGGGLMNHSWGSDFEDMADWLNDKGIAAIGVKYRTRIIDRNAPRQAAPQQPMERPKGKSLQNMNLEITDFALIQNANTSPAAQGADDTLYEDVAEDCINAMKVVLDNASKWGLDPKKIGWLGFSAGGGVEFAGLMKAESSLFPAFVATCFGPSFVDITVPENAPKLFIAVHADHANVSAGLMALFFKWKEAGVDTEMHIYAKPTGKLYAAGSNVPDRSTPNGSWREQFYSWMVANGFTDIR